MLDQTREILVRLVTRPSDDNRPNRRIYLGGSFPWAMIAVIPTILTITYNTPVDSQSSISVSTINGFTGYLVNGVTTIVPDQSLSFDQTVTSVQFWAATSDVDSTPIANGLTGIQFGDFITSATITGDIAALSNFGGSFPPVVNIPISNTITSLSVNGTASTIDLTKYPILQSLAITNNSGLTTVDLSNLSLLQALIITSAAVTDINLLPISATLTYLQINESPLSSVDISDAVNLTSLEVSNSPITTVNLTPLTALQTFTANNSVFTNLVITGNTQLTDLSLPSNHSLLAVTLSALPALRTISLDGSNLLQSFDFTDTGLVSIDMVNTGISAIDTTKLPSSLQYLRSSSSLSAITLSSTLTSLNTIVLDNNTRITSFNATTVPSLTSFSLLSTGILRQSDIVVADPTLIHYVGLSSLLSTALSAIDLSIYRLSDGASIGGPGIQTLIIGSQPDSFSLNLFNTTKLHTLDLSSLSATSGVQLNNCTNLTALLNIPSISNFQTTNLNRLSAITFQSGAQASGYMTGSHTGPLTIGLANTTVVNFSVQYYTIGAVDVTGAVIQTFNLYGCPSTSDVVDTILITANAGGYLNGSLTLDVGTTRTAASDVAYNNLITNGWTISIT